MHMLISDLNCPTVFAWSQLVWIIEVALHAQQWLTYPGTQNIALPYKNLYWVPNQYDNAGVDPGFWKGGSEIAIITIISINFYTLTL